MAVDPATIGATSEPRLVAWTDRDTLLYALAVGAGEEDLAFTTENSHQITQQVLPTFAVVACTAADGMNLFGTYNRGALLHGSQETTLFAPLPAAGALTIVTEVADLQDKGEGKNAVVLLRTRGSDPDTGAAIAETVTTLVIRGGGGFKGEPGERPAGPETPVREPDARITQATRTDQALLYRLTGDRNPLHSDPWFAREKAGFPKPILHGLCTYGIAGHALVTELGGGDASKIASIATRFTAPVYPGDVLVTSIWRIGENRAVFQTTASNVDGSQVRLVLGDGSAAYSD